MEATSAQEWTSAISTTMVRWTWPLAPPVGPQPTTLKLATANSMSSSETPRDSRHRRGLPSRVPTTNPSAVPSRHSLTACQEIILRPRQEIIP